MLCRINKTFTYSDDGIKSLVATKGEAVDIPDHLVCGLQSEGWLTKDAGAAPENKMMPAPENKIAVEEPEQADDIDDLRDQYREITGKKAHHNSGADKLRADIDAALADENE